MMPPTCGTEQPSSVPDLSIVVTLWNCASSAALLEHSLADLEAPSTSGRVEVVLVDDASSDGSLDAYRSVVPESMCIKTVKLPVRSGPGSARNAGLRVAQGQFLAFWDADDSGHIEVFRALAAQMRANLEQRPIGCVGYKIRNLSSGQDLGQELPRATQPLRELIVVRAAVWRFLFDRSFLLENNIEFPPLSYGEDLLFLLRCSRAVYQPVLGIPSLGYVYNWRGSGTLSSSNEASANEVLEALSQASEQLTTDEDLWLVSEWYLRVWLRRRGYRNPKTYAQIARVIIRATVRGQARPFLGALVAARRSALS